MRPYGIVLRLEPTICFGVVMIYYKDGKIDQHITVVVSDKDTYFHYWMITKTWDLQVGEVVRPRRLLNDLNPGSGRMFFLGTEPYDGESNIQFITEPKITIFTTSKTLMEEFDKALKESLENYTIIDGKFTNTSTRETKGLNTNDR